MTDRMHSSRLRCTLWRLFVGFGQALPWIAVLGMLLVLSWHEI